MLSALTARPHLKVPVTRTFDNIVATAPGLVSWWKANETSGTVMKDYGGSGYDATYNTSANVTLGAAPIRAGSTGCVQLTANDYAANRGSLTGTPLDSPRLGSGQNWTIAAIVKVTGGGSVVRRCFGWGPGTFGNAGGPDMHYRTSDPTHLRGDAGTGAGNFISPNATSGTALLIALTKDSANGYTLWENGVAVATTTFVYVTPTYSAIEMLGSSGFTGSYGFVGFGCDFMMANQAWNATTLLPLAQAAGFV